MFEQDGGIIDNELATTVAYLLDTSVDVARQLIDCLLSVPKTEPRRVAVVVDLILDHVHSTTATDAVVLPARTGDTDRQQG